MTLALRFAARSDVGLLRGGNEDSGYAGPHVLAIADGMGGAAAGEVASSVAIAAFAALDESDAHSDLLGELRRGYARAHDHLVALTEVEPALSGMGTTLTVLLRSGSRVGLLHVGDTRGYLLRDDVLDQITHDHTLVQSLVDTGQIAVNEARTHPQRNIITKALDSAGRVEPDLSIRELRVGDRILLCSDGLSGVVTEDTLHEVLATTAEPSVAAHELIALALRAGGPDNVTCVVADVVDGDDEATLPSAVGAVSVTRSSRRIALPDSPATRAAELTESGQAKTSTLRGSAARRHRRFVWLLAIGMLAAGIAMGAVFGWYTWAQRQYYVGVAGDGALATVAVYRGPAQALFGLQLSSVVQTTDLRLESLPDFEKQQVMNTIPARSLGSASQIVQRLRDQAAGCNVARPPSGCPGTP